MELKPNITFDTYLSLDIRVCQVVAAERVPKTDKLLKLTLNTGVDQRECVTNLGELFTPEQFVGQKLAFLLNLEPTVIRKIESRAMIFLPSTKGDILTAYQEYEVGEVIFN